MRVYVPATLAMLQQLVADRSISAVNGTALAVTPALRESYSEGDTARMGLELVNEGSDADVLLGVSTPIAADTRLVVDPAPPEEADRATPVPSIAVGPAAGAGPVVVRAYVELRDLRVAAREGQTYPVTFHFRSAGSIDTTVPVEIPTGP